MLHFTVRSQSLVFHLAQQTRLLTLHTVPATHRSNRRPQQLPLESLALCSNMSTFTSSVRAQQVHLQILAVPPPPCALHARKPWSALLPFSSATAPGVPITLPHHLIAGPLPRISALDGLDVHCLVGFCVPYDGLIPLTICLSTQL
jgi:hypothetical protein